MRAMAALMLSMALAACTSKEPASATPQDTEPRFEAVPLPAGPDGLPEGHAKITGTVTYGTQTPPPIGAKLELSLEDVSRADAPAEVISVGSITSSTSPPGAFDISYDPSVLIPNHRYVVRAKILQGDQLLFISDTSPPVFGPSNVTHVEIPMRRVTVPQMRGMYSYMADAGWYTDCLTGVRMPVAQEGDNAALERAYSKAGQMAGAPLLAVVEGRVADRVPMEGAKRPTLIVEKFISVESQGCSGPQSTAQLENTYWKLMTLGGVRMESPQGAREIHFVLHSEGHRVAGFAGCNQMMGSYQLKGEKLDFSQVGGTLMACEYGMEQEQQFQQAFARVAGWKIAGETLQLLDGAGAVLATFESRYLR